MECDKIGYITQSEAVAVIKGMANDGNKSPMKHYKCQECGLFHLATKGKRKKMRQIQSGPSQTRFPMTKSGKLPKSKRPDKPLYDSGNKLLSKEQAAHLKRLIEGNNNMFKKLSQ